ncbi:MAG: enoyl-CoA hydratase [Rhodospirillales bacterium]
MSKDETAAPKMLSEKRGSVGHMIFNNPERYNAVSLDMWDAAEKILDGFVADDEIRVIVMSGAGGKAFVSGADISKFEKERGSQEAVAHYNARIKVVYDKIAALPKPTIAMINGFCLGGGLALAVSCDLRFCSSNSKFGLPAAKLGLGYPYGGLNRLVDTVGLGQAKDIVFSARRMDSDEALRIGLVQQIVDEADLEQTVMDYAETVAGNAPLTVAALKFIIGETRKDSEDRDMDKCQAMVDACFASEDYIEGRRAFMEKRPAQFKGR